MKKAETLFTGIALLSVLVVTSGALWYHNYAKNTEKNHIYPESQYGSFLAAQHAIYVNDFESASAFSAKLTENQYPVVQSVKVYPTF